MVSACVSGLSSDRDEPFRRMKSNNLGSACSVRFDPKTVSGSKQCLNAAPASLTAKKLRNPRASTTPSFKLNNNSSSDKYDQPAFTNSNASVDFPLPDGPMISTPL